MKKYLNKWMFLPALLFVVVGCGPAAHIEKDSAVDFSKYNTFAWADKEPGDSNVNNSLSDLTEKNLQTAVNRELNKTGWTESKRRPDILLSYALLVERSTVENNNPVFTQPFSRVLYNPYYRRYFIVNYPSQFAGYDREVRQVKEGTVTLTMIDAKTGKTVWQGWATDEVSNRNLTSKEIDAVVRSIFRKADLAKK